MTNTEDVTKELFNVSLLDIYVQMETNQYIWDLYSAIQDTHIMCTCAYKI